MIATVGIAWGIVLGAPGTGLRHFSMSGTPMGARQWIRETPADWPEPLGTSIISPDGRFDPRTFVPHVGSLVRLRQGMNNGISGTRAGGTSFLGDDPRYVVDVYRVGWPWKTMEWRGPDDARPVAATWAGRLFESGIPIGSERALPLAPAWPGFWLSALMWAGAVGLPLLALAGIRRRRLANRERAGRCRVCGYDLAGLGVCPECGAGAPSTDKANR